MDEHLGIATEFEAALSKLDAVEDGQLYLWFLMQAGTQRLNAKLHAMRLTSERTAGERGIPGDFVHSDAVPNDIANVRPVAEMVRCLRYLEDLRADYVRGPRSLDPETLASSRAAYEKICRSSVVQPSSMVRS